MQVIDFYPWLINVKYIESVRQPTKIDENTWNIEIRMIPDNGSYYSQTFSSEIEAITAYNKIISGFTTLNK